MFEQLRQETVVNRSTTEQNNREIFEKCNTLQELKQAILDEEVIPQSEFSNGAAQTEMTLDQKLKIVEKIDGAMEQAINDPNELDDILAPFGEGPLRDRLQKLLENLSTPAGLVSVRDLVPHETKMIIDKKLDALEKNILFLDTKE